MPFHDLVVEPALGLAAGGGEEQASGVAKSAVQEAHGDEHGIGAVAIVVLQPQLQRVGVGGRFPDRSGRLEQGGDAG
jgi:hypothetical protein